MLFPTLVWWLEGYLGSGQHFFGGMNAKIPQKTPATSKEEIIPRRSACSPVNRSLGSFYALNPFVTSSQTQSAFKDLPIASERRPEPP